MMFSLKDPCGIDGAEAPFDLSVFYVSVNVDNNILAARQMDVARDCARLSLEIANYGSDN
jgi:hypothetical protein